MPKPRGEGNPLRLSNFLTQELSEAVAGTTFGNVGSFRTKLQIRVFASQNAGVGTKGFLGGVAVARATHGLPAKLGLGCSRGLLTLFTRFVREFRIALREAAVVESFQ